MLDGRALAALSLKSEAALRRMAVAGPPGGFGDVGRAVEEPVLGFSEGEVAGEDYLGGRYGVNRSSCQKRA